MAVKNRDEIEEKYKWDLSSMFPSDEAFLAELEEAKGYVEKCAAFAGTISQSPENLLAFLRLDDEITIKLSRLYNYAQRKCDEDTRISKYQSYSSQALSVLVSVNSAGAWFRPELLSMSEETMEQFYAQCPDLELYRRSLDRIFVMKEHTLSPTEEALLASAQEMASQPENIYSMFANADLTFDDAVDSNGEHHAVTTGSYVALQFSNDRVLRKSAYESMYRAYGKFRNTCAATLAAQSRQLKFFADARKYPNTLAAALASTEVPESVYTNLIEAVHNNMGAMHKYVRLRKKLLGVDELHFYDVYAPIVSDVEMNFTYEEACEIILKALEPLGEEYLALVRQGLNSRWVDVYENPGKRSGAYSAGGYGMQPVILLNFQGTLDDVFTLIHEMGHSIHTYLSCANQPSCYSDYVIFVAEVASTCNEALLMQYFLKTTTDKRQRAYLLNHYMEQFKGTLYRQCMFAEFELEMNRMNERGEGITAESLSAMYHKLNEEYFGEAMIVDDMIELEWARIPHFYYNYYVYQYSTGYTAAIALSQRILREGAPAVQDYLNFLKGGCSKTPIELLRGAGVDMASPEPVNEALHLFDGIVDEMDALTGE